MRKVIILAIIVLLIGYFLRNETLVYCIGDTYYVATYLTLAIYIIYALILSSLITYLVRKVKNKSAD